MNQSTINNNAMQSHQQPLKRKSGHEEDNTTTATVKRVHTAITTSLPSPEQEQEDHVMDELITMHQSVPHMHQNLPPRSTTPPLGMTLSHYDASTGTYTSSQLNSNHEVKSQICTGMTPVYRAPFERWGSCLI